MATKDYIISMTSICDTKEGFERLKEALNRIDEELHFKEKKQKIHNTKNQIIYTSYEAFYKLKKEIPLCESEGKIAKDYIYLYPPGIPIIVPGELISKELIADILEYKEFGFQLKGLPLEGLNYISVIDEEKG